MSKNELLRKIEQLEAEIESLKSENDFLRHMIAIQQREIDIPSVWTDSNPTIKSITTSASSGDPSCDYVYINMDGQNISLTNGIN
jgi:cell shape-determining protein MreC